LRGPVSVAARHVEHPQTTQIVAQPPQQGASLTVTAKVHLVAYISDRFFHQHPSIICGAARNDAADRDSQMSSVITVERVGFTVLNCARLGRRNTGNWRFRA
jgi:hypothetical protein